MAIQVNPPPLLRIPRKFLEDKEVAAFIEQQNVIIFQLWNRTGAEVDIVSEGSEGVTENAENIAINALAITGNTDQIAINADAINDNTDLINANTGLINEVPVYSGFMAQIQFLQRQFDGLPEFTIDTTGFTFDSTKITFDKVIA
jgi:hypothetical protein